MRFKRVGSPQDQAVERSRARFGGFWTARRTLTGFAAMAMIRKGQVKRLYGNDVKAQATFVANLKRADSMRAATRPCRC
jgi:hypothetical protein